MPSFAPRLRAIDTRNEKPIPIRNIWIIPWMREGCSWIKRITKILSRNKVHGAYHLKEFFILSNLRTKKVSPTPIHKISSKISYRIVMIAYSNVYKSDTWFWVKNIRNCKVRRNWNRTFWIIRIKCKVYQTLLLTTHKTKQKFGSSYRWKCFVKAA